MLRQAFNSLMYMHSRAATLKRFGSPDVTSEIRISPSNYFRYQDGPSHTNIKQREFIIPVDSIETPFSDGLVKLGDRIIDSVLGTMTIVEVEEMVDIGSAIMGLRCKCE